MIPKNYDTSLHPKTAILAVDAPYNQINDISSYFIEFESLVRTHGIPFDAAAEIKIRDVDSTYFFTKGKLSEVKEFCDDNEIEILIISEALTTQQERNMSNVLECEVFDRTRLILEIFENTALSAEGKTQVEIAMLQFQKSRLTGRGIHMSQQAGGIGVRGGPGETAKESDLRYINDHIHKLRKQLKQIEKTREVQRKKRMLSKVPKISIIGYTNAGKSTILNTLTKAAVLAEDKLFATLDTTTRELFNEDRQIGVISDTVGFIQQLPHQLVEAFKSTLSELKYSDLLLHVIDASDKNWDMHAQIVHTILEELEVDKPILYVFNKIDLVEDMEEFKAQSEDYTPNVTISATNAKGIKPLKDYLSNWHK
jgi:GTPase